MNLGISKYKKLTDLNFSDIEDHAVVMVYSDDCPDCDMAKTVALEEHPNVSIYLLDYDIEEELCEKFEAYTVPFYVYLYKKEPIGRVWGMQEPQTIHGWIDYHFKNNK